MVSCLWWNYRGSMCDGSGVLVLTVGSPVFREVRLGEELLRLITALCNSSALIFALLSHLSRRREGLWQELGAWHQLRNDLITVLNGCILAVNGSCVSATSMLYQLVLINRPPVSSLRTQRELDRVSRACVQTTLSCFSLLYLKPNDMSLIISTFIVN